MDLKKAFTKNKLVKNTIIYGATNAMYTGLPLLLLPFLVVTLSPEDYGNVDLFRSISMVLVPVLGLSTLQSIGRFYYDLDEDTFKKFVSTIQLFQFISSFLALILLFLFSQWIDPLLFKIIYLCILYFLFNQITESLLVIYRVKDKAIKYFVFRVLNIVLELSFIYVLFISYEKLDWTFRVYPTVIASFIIALLAVYQFIKLGYRFYFSKQLLYSSIAFSAPLILHMLSGYMLNIGDRFFIKYFLTPQDLGNYAVAYQIGMAINFFYTSFNLAWTPTYFKWMKEGKLSQILKVRKFVYLVIPLLGFIIMLIWLFFNKIFLGKLNYNISTEIIVIVLISNVIFSLYKFDANYYLYRKKTKKLSLLSLLSAIISIICNFILIPRIGILGAAYSTLISFIVLFVLVKFNKKRL